MPRHPVLAQDGDAETDLAAPPRRRPAEDSEDREVLMTVEEFELLQQNGTV